jgi:hypothetical protein
MSPVALSARPNHELESALFVSGSDVCVAFVSEIDQIGVMRLRAQRPQ